MLVCAQHDIACGTMAPFEAHLAFFDKSVPESQWSDPDVCIRISDSLHAHIDRARLGFVDSWTYDRIAGSVPGASRGLQVRTPTEPPHGPKHAPLAAPESPASPRVGAFRPSASLGAASFQLQPYDGSAHVPSAPPAEKRSIGEQVYVVESPWSREAVPTGGIYMDPVILDVGGRHIRHVSERW